MSAASAIEYLKKLPPDEPVFVLRAQDITAAGFVMAWANNLAHLTGVFSPKADEALDIAREMEAWPTQKVPD